MDTQKLRITFEGASPADASRFAQDLEGQLSEVSPSVNVSVEKTRPETQDFGATLVLLFGTPVAIALAKAVTTFLQRNLGASITITRGGTVIAKNLDSSDAARIAEAFASKAH